MPENNGPHLKQVLDAQQAGYDAAVTGERANACPYATTEKQLRDAWVAGYVAARSDLRRAAGLPPDHGKP